MLRIINELKPFFEDCYRRINVREYARIVGVSPPTGSKTLSFYYKEGLLLREKYKNLILYYANHENKNFIDFSRIYWSYRFDNLVTFIEDKLISPTVVLFGSFAKAEVKHDSDIDLVIFSHKRKLDLSDFERKLKRKIQVFWFLSVGDIKSKELANNILNGYILGGKLSL